MLPWETRPTEFAHLFNPAFCSILLQGAIREFEKQKQQGMPYALLFLVLPIVLHKSTRQVLPRGTATKLHTWLQAHPEVLVSFTQRTRNLVPYTKEALAFGLHTNIITCGDSGSLTWVRRRIREQPWASDTELAECYSKAKLLGRWFAISGEETTIYTMWGVRP